MTIGVTGREDQITAELNTLKAATDLSSYIHRFMYISGGLVTYTTAVTAGYRIIGVLKNKPTAANMPCQLAIGGIGSVEAGGTVTQDSQVMSDSTGRAVVKSGAAECAGIALDAATTAGQFVRIVFQPTYFAA